MSQSMPQTGERAPAFSSQDQNGRTVSLSDFTGRSPLILYFYPKADTPGCTNEARGFRDLYTEFQAAGVPVLGCSTDSVKRQARFAEKYEIPFPLLADVDRMIAESYGVWKEKTFMGRKYMGVDRVTFLIDRDGIVRGVFSRFDISAHPRQMLEAAKALS